MEGVLTTRGNVIMITIVGMEVMRARIVRIISEPVNPTLNSHVKMQNVSLKPTNVMEKMIVETEVMNLTVVSNYNRFQRLKDIFKKSAYHS